MTEDERQLQPRKRGRPRKNNNNNLLNLQHDIDSGQFLMFSLALARLPKIDPRDPVAVENRTMDYFQLCAEQNMKPSVPGLALALGVTRSTVRSWLEGLGAGKSAGVKDAVQTAFTILTAQMEQYMLEGGINPIAGIFIMRNNFGYANEDIPIDEGMKDLSAGKTATELAKEYENLPD